MRDSLGIKSGGYYDDVTMKHSCRFFCITIPPISPSHLINGSSPISLCCDILQTPILYHLQCIYYHHSNVLYSALMVVLWGDVVKKFWGSMLEERFVAIWKELITSDFLDFASTMNKAETCDAGGWLPSANCTHVCVCEWMNSFLWMWNAHKQLHSLWIVLLWLCSLLINLFPSLVTYCALHPCVFASFIPGSLQCINLMQEFVSLTLEVKVV